MENLPPLLVDLIDAPFHAPSSFEFLALGSEYICDDDKVEKDFNLLLAQLLEVFPERLCPMGSPNVLRGPDLREQSVQIPRGSVGGQGLKNKFEIDSILTKYKNLYKPIAAF